MKCSCSVRSPVAMDACPDGQPYKTKHIATYWSGLAIASGLPWNVHYVSLGAGRFSLEHLLSDAFPVSCIESISCSLFGFGRADALDKSRSGSSYRAQRPKNKVCDSSLTCARRTGNTSRPEMCAAPHSRRLYQAARSKCKFLRKFEQVEV